MIKRKDQLKVEEYKREDGKKIIALYDLKDFEGMSDKINQFSFVELGVGEEVKFHVHEGDSENYFIVEGKGLYNDNGIEIEVSDGTITFTPSGQGHALKNIGCKTLKFIALVIKN